MKPATPAAASTPRCESGRGWRSRSIVSTSATHAEMKIASTTKSPAIFSPRDERNRKATASGMAVSASPMLWMVSASSATDPDARNTTAWTAAVAPSTTRLIATVRTPSRERRIERSTRPCEWS